jgi:hypothetical protein
MASGIVTTGNDNDRIVLSNPVTDDPATVAATRSVTNQTVTHDYDAIYGAPGANLGTIKGGTPIRRKRRREQPPRCRNPFDGRLGCHQRAKRLEHRMGFRGVTPASRSAPKLRFMLSSK